MQRPTQEFEALFNNAAIGMIAVDTGGVITLVNRFALNQFGYGEEDELIGKPIEVLIPQRYRQKHEGLRRNYHGNNPHARPMGHGIDLYGCKKGGEEFPVEISLSVYNVAEGQYAIAFINDISVRKRSEEALVRLNAELEQKVTERTQSLQEALDKEKELNELKSRFVSMASHEFRTPLSTILSSVFLLQKYIVTEDQPKREKHIQRIASSVNMLNDILNDFLSVGKIEEGRVQVRMAEVDVQREVEGMVAELRPILKPGQTIVTQHEGAATAMLDATMLKHIVMNLVSNAIKFSPEDALIEVETHGDETGHTLLVRDRGIGISAEDQKHLFERFFRAANATNIQGTGLGLHIVCKYAELMNGSIRCESELDKGTTFIVTFPRGKKV
jgi:PAS domain S-box-containing protein